MIELNSFLNSVSKNKDTTEDNLQKLSFLLCKEFGWDYYTLINQPLPFIFAMLEEYKKYKEAEEKSMKRK